VTDVDDFTAFVRDFDRPLRQALVPLAGVRGAHDAACDAFSYAWEHWERISAMANPRGYVYTAARRYARRKPSTAVPIELAGTAELPDVEPRLIAALAELSEMQRTVVYLVEGCGWGLTDAGDLLGISISTVRSHLVRGMTRLRTILEVTNGV
jgi:DNA-directed RNA polymerase specialized sigma24 family protein